MQSIFIAALFFSAVYFFPLKVAESATVDEIGCVTILSHHHRSDAAMSALVRVGGKWLYFHENEIRVSGPVVFLTRAQVAAWETLLAEFRTAAAAKVKARIWYDNATNVLSAHTVDFDKPC